MRGAHRQAWLLTHGEIPEGKWILHHCDVPHCVNPAHLYVGTAKDNMRDILERGRYRSANGAKTHCPHGHPYDAQNTARDWRGRRRCRRCHLDYLIRYRASRKAA